MNRIYLPSLDGVRFFAFFAVFLNHVPFPGEGWPLTTHERGWAGVEMFFALSAFLLFTLLRAEYEKTGTIKVGNFFIRRILRIYPLMIAAPILFIVIGNQMQNPLSWEQWWYLATFRDNILPDTTFNTAIPFATHLWTLSFEFQVYAVIPIAFFLSVKLGRDKFILALLTIWLASLAARFYYASVPVHHPTIYFSPWLRPDSVLVGILVSLLPVGFNKKHALLAVGLAGFGLVWFLQMPNVNAEGTANTFIYTAAALVCGSLLWLAINVPGVRSAMANRFLVYLGKRSFGLYVFHLLTLHIVGTQFQALLGSIEPTNAYVIKLILGLILTIVFAELSYTLFERFFLRLKDMRAVVLSRPI